MRHVPATWPCHQVLLAARACSCSLSGAWPQVSLDANAFLVGMLARQAAKQPRGPRVAAASQMSPPQRPPQAPPALGASTGTAAKASASMLAPVLGNVASASAAGAAAASCSAEVRVSAPWPTGNKAAGYAATVSLLVTNTASTAASAPLRVVVFPNTTQAGYVDAGNGPAWGWDSFSVTGGTAQGSIMQVCQPPFRSALSMHCSPAVCLSLTLLKALVCARLHTPCVLAADQRMARTTCVRAQGAAAWSQDIYLGRHPRVQRPRLGAVKGHPERHYLPAADSEARTPLGSQRHTPEV